MVDRLRRIFRHDSRIDEILSTVRTILESLPRPTRATRLALELPTITRKGIPMTTFPLRNDEVLTVTLKALDAQGGFEPFPAGDTFSIANTDPLSLNAVMGVDANGNTAVLLNALVPLQSTVIGITVSDSAGLKAIEQDFIITADTTPVAMMLDLADATHVSQPVPLGAPAVAATA